MTKAWASDEVDINGKNVKVSYIFGRSSLYSDREFRESDLLPEWRNFLNYLMKRKTPLQKTRDPQVYNLLIKFGAKFKASQSVYPDIDFFKRSVRLILGKGLRAFLIQTPQVVRGDSLSVQIKMVKTGRERDLVAKWDGALIGTICTYDRAFLEISGEYLIDMIVGPLFMLETLQKKKALENPTIIAHELTHQIGLKSVQFYDRVFEEKWKEIVSKASIRYAGVPRRSGGTVVLIQTAYGIEAEVLSMFREKRNLKEVPIIPKYAQEFREKLEKLAKITDEEIAKKYFEDEIDIFEVQGAGTYYWALVIPLTIALALAKRIGKHEIFLRTEDGKEYHFTNFAKLLRQGKTFYIPRLPDELFKRTLQYIYKNTYTMKDKKGKILESEGGKPLTPVLRFKRTILLYEEACKTLGVKKQDMALTWTYFYNLYRYARTFYKERYKNLVEEAGFIYEDLKTAYY